MLYRGVRTPSAISARASRLRRVILAGALLALIAAGSAWAFQQLPAGGQVNDDAAAGIDPARSVSGEDPTNADVVGGALTAGKPAVPWSLMRQTETTHDQIFSRSFAGGVWSTRGGGTVGGRSSAGPAFSGSLNFDQGQDGEAPSIDFAGAGRTVPWASWYETTANIGGGTGFGAENIFASRFDNSGDASQGKWIFGGQGRGTGGGAVPVPSLNIHTNENAENPSVAGGSAVDPTKPGPWVSWQETSTNGADQIFVSRPLGPGQANCDGVTPLGVAVEGHVPAVGGFCWQQTGNPRIGPGGEDPSLNVDPTRDGVEPDIAFTGKSDAVPWVVWYEQGASKIGLDSNELVFAAKGVQDAGAQGGFHWQVVGSALGGTLDVSGANKFGECAASHENEEKCSLNKNAGADAEDVRVASGTMDPANPTVPWAVWDEDVNEAHQIVVSRLVGTGADAHFELANNGAPISVGDAASTRPDITFSGNTPYVSWREATGGGTEKAFLGHFVNPADPTFVLDESDVPLTPAAQADVREPISSSCTANPFNADGAACQGGAGGTPFFLFTNGTSPLGLFSGAYQPDAPLTGASGGIGASTATVAGSVNPHGASVGVEFEFGTTTAYGRTTAIQASGPADSAVPVSTQLTGLPAGTAIHYRIVAISDFGGFAGADQVLTTTDGVNKPPPPAARGATVSRVKVSGSTASVSVSCFGASGATCRVSLRLTITETLRNRRVIGIAAKLKHKVVVIGSASVTLAAGRSKTVKISLNSAGRHLLARRHRLKVTLRGTQTPTGVHAQALTSQVLTFKAPKKRSAHH